MGQNKIGAGSALLAVTLPIAMPAGAVFAVPAGQGLVGAFGAVAAPQLNAGNTLSGQYVLQLGQYTTLQVYDAGLQYWRNVNIGPMQLVPVSSDGINYRIINSTGCPVGALVTAAGSGGTNGFFGYNQSRAAINIVNGITTLGNAIFTITPSAGGSLWNAIVGGAINTTISLTGTVYQNNPVFGGTGTSFTASGGSNYLAAPLLVFTPPPNQGQQPYILPEAICTISAGAINSITVTQQGAGLLGLPGITVVNAYGDTTGGGALLGWIAANAGQVGSGTVMAMWPTFPGTALTAVPTFAYGGTSNPAPTATAIMNFTITSFTTGTAGVGYVGAGGIVFGGIVAGSAANTNPILDKALSIPVPPPLNVAATTGIPTLAGPFGGVNFQAIPLYAAFSAGAAASTAAAITANVGGASDSLLFISI
jgi:hypothetical protein